MITVYPSGNALLEEHRVFLSENRYMSTFFFFDAPLLKECNKKEYAIAVSQGDKRLLALKVEPFNVLLYGDGDCLEEFLAFVAKEGYGFSGAMCPCHIGEGILALSKKTLGKEFVCQIAMDFMEADRVQAPVFPEVGHATLDDVDEIYECEEAFFLDCGLPDKPSRDRIASVIDHFFVLREDGKIVSMAKWAPDTEDSLRVSCVYTRPKYRGRGLAKKTVGTVKNAILRQGKKATLNVDQKNPISYHLYESLGFHKVFAQGIYLPK